MAVRLFYMEGVPLCGMVSILRHFELEVNSASSGRTALHEMMIEYIGPVS